MTEEPPTLGECVHLLHSHPGHPRAKEYARGLIAVMDQHVDQGKLTLDKRHAYYTLLASVLFPPRA